ncbi:unnamed protein product [Brassicogethes aeneus]|uniref:RING-type E3 ubiquitin transferase n=1 Tax=Brassicogethes aeneus TaxID=1431903 RepID=A0A9P0AXP3_BRAAE|nr:unnamed protein product [Brassicogethes aeneus]
MCEFKPKSCPMLHYKGCEWKGCNWEISGHFAEIHQKHVIKSENNIFKVKASLSEAYNVKLLSDNSKNCILNILIANQKFYYALNPIEQSMENDEYSVKHKSIKSEDNYLTTGGTLKRLNVIYTERNLNKNPNSTAVSLASLKHLADKNNMITNEFNLNPKGIDENTLKQLECPVCMNIMRPPIYQCAAGHSICILCRKKVKQCPLCQKGWTDSRNYFVENLTTNIKYPCKFYEAGCKEVLIDDRIRKHEESCDFQTYQCKMECHQIGNYQFILKHLMNHHKDMEYTKDMVIYYTPNESLTKKWIIFDLMIFYIKYLYDPKEVMDLAARNKDSHAWLPKMPVMNISVFNSPLLSFSISLSQSMGVSMQRLTSTCQTCEQSPPRLLLDQIVRSPPTPPQRFEGIKLAPFKLKFGRTSKSNSSTRSNSTETAECEIGSPQSGVPAAIMEGQEGQEMDPISPPPSYEHVLEEVTLIILMF